MTIVVDASVIVATLFNEDGRGAWAEDLLAREDLLAPHILPAEVASVLRRLALAGQISADSASLAHRDLETLPVRLVPYAPLASRIWELRRSVTIYDAWYVALAEAYDLPLATLDRRLASSPGPRCEFLTPPGATPDPG